MNFYFIGQMVKTVARRYPIINHVDPIIDKDEVSVKEAINPIRINAFQIPCTPDVLFH